MSRLKPTRGVRANSVRTAQSTPRISGRWSTIAALVGALALSCSDPAPQQAPPPAAPEAPPRVLVIGVDGASKGLVESMRQEGLLPNLDAIAREGSTGVASPTGYLLSPRIWTTVATGKLPEKHGIHSWVRPEGEEGVRLYSSRDRTAHALWNMFSDAGYSVAVVNWLMTQPPEEINGVMISDHAAEGSARASEMLAAFSNQPPTGPVDPPPTGPDTVGGAGLTYPAGWQNRLADLREGEAVTELPDPFTSERGWLGEHPIFGFLRKMYRNDAFAARTALAIEEELRPDLMLVYLPGIDRMSHILWYSVEPEEALESIPEESRPSQWERKVHGDALRLYYRHVDAIIGRLLEGRSPDDLVIVLSDHGFELDLSETPPRGTHVSNAARDGILYLRGRGIPRGRSDLRMKMAQFAPTILAWMGMPTAEDMDGVPAEFLDAPPSGQIATYDLTPVRRVESQNGEIESRIIEDLKGLGYVE